MFTIGRCLGAIIGMAFALAGSSALADKRVALVVGNSAYRNVTSLDNPAHDAKLTAETLRSLGFKLVGGGAQLDLDKADFDAAVQSFGNQLQGADVGCSTMPATACRCAARTIWCRLAPIPPERPMSISRCSIQTWCCDRWRARVPSSTS